jgi:hypothetical protein
MTVPVTLTRTSHALTIRANGVAVGLINGWNPTQGRTVTPIFEVGVDGSGNPVEYMPGNATGLNISINRYDLYTLRMEEAFGTPDLTMLTRQNEPFDVFEVWQVPDITALELALENAGIEAGTIKPKERFVYRGCWFTSLGRTIRADDNRIVNVNATLVYTQKLKVTGLASSIPRAFGIRL